MNSLWPLRAPPSSDNPPQVELLARAIDSVGSAILITDADDRIVWLNQAFVQLSGYAACELLGATTAMLAAEPLARAEYRALWQEMPDRTDSWRGERVNRHRNGSLYMTDETVNALKDGNGQITHFIALQHDITQQKMALRQERERANRDALTGLACRAHFLVLQQSAIAAAAQSGGLVAVLFLDLDGFKAINDTFGHQTGDTVLRAVAERLQRAVRGSDTVARFGGDEFVVLLPAIVHRRAALRLARKIVALLAQPFAIAEGCHGLSASVGVAFYPDHGATGECLLDQADQAMYCAKRGGGNHYRLFDAEPMQAWRDDAAGGRIARQRAWPGVPDNCAGHWQRPPSALRQRTIAP